MATDGDVERSERTPLTSNDKSTADEACALASPLHLSFFMAFALIEGLIQCRYRIWWAATMNAVLVASGFASQVVRETKPKWTAVSFVTFLIWLASALIGLVLFLIFVVVKGRENLLLLCLADSTASSYGPGIPMGTCAEFSTDGTFTKIWIAAITIGVFLGFPFMFVAVRTTYLFYAEARVAATAT